MASDVKNVSVGENDVTEGRESLVEESVRLQQPSFEKAEAKFLELSLNDGLAGSETVQPPTRSVPPLAQETVWLRQHQYESAETLYYMHLAGTAHLKVTPGTPGKRHHVQDNRAQSKKQKQDMKASDFWNKKFKTEGASLLKTSRTVQSRLEELQKVQQRKCQVIKDATSRIAAVMEDCQTRLADDLVKSSQQMDGLKSLLSEIEAVVDKTTIGFAEKKWGHFKTQEKYCKKISESLSKLGKDLNSSYDLCNCFLADASKSDINRIVGDIGKLSLIKKHFDGDVFLKKKEVVANSIKCLLEAGDDSAAAFFSDTESSLEGSCSGSSDGTANNTGKNLKPSSGKGSKSKKAFQNNKHAAIKPNRNSANVMQAGRNKGDTASMRPKSGHQSAPVKRNAQGVQSAVDKRQDLFHFRGDSRPSSVPFLSQPGLLGPRPNALSMHGSNLQAPFRFPQYNTAGQKQQGLSNFGTQVNQSGFGNMNFNFSSAQSRASSLNYGQNSTLASQQARNMMSQAKMYQAQQQPARGAKTSDRTLGPKQNFGYPQQQKTGGSAFMQKSHTGLLGSHPSRGDSRGNLEQQLNEMGQKIQQMQLAASHNIQLQHLMRETERLKQLVVQKQHQHQQQDRFQQQFQLLINSFMQQQQQQQFQGPQSKMARAVQYQNPQKQQQQHNKHLQQQKKRKQQQNKVQQVKQEPQNKPLQIEAEKEKQESKPIHEAVLQNGENSFTLELDAKIVSENSRVTIIGTFSPQASGDKHKAGVSSLVVMEHIGCVVVVDIINSCLKLYNVSVTESAQPGLSHHLVTRLELSRPYYMGKLNKDMIVVSREGQILSLVKVSKKRLEFLQDMRTESQYYGLGYVRDNVIVCAAFNDNRIDLLSIQDGIAQTAVLLTQCNGPELVAALPSTGCILYLERVRNETVHLLGISQQGLVEFSINLECSPTDVWSVASISDKIVCCNKQSAQVKLFSQDGVLLTNIPFPPGTVYQPFAVTFCDSGRIYIANDGAWDSEFEHYITTDINVYSFS